MGYGQRPRRTKSPGFAWTGTSNELIDRICPRRHHFEFAILGAALMVSVAAVIAAPASQPERRYEFFAVGDRVIVANRSSGTVAICRAEPKGMRCTDDDSPWEARYRKERFGPDEED